MALVAEYEPTIDPDEFHRVIAGVASGYAEELRGAIAEAVAEATRKVLETRVSCERCERPFLRTHGSQRFCPSRERGAESLCGLAARQARFRARRATT